MGGHDLHYPNPDIDYPSIKISGLMGAIVNWDACPSKFFPDQMALLQQWLHADKQESNPDASKADRMR